MRLKKAVGILAVSMMVFSLLAGCAKKEEADSQSESTEAATEASEAAEETKIEKPESYGTVKLGEYKGVEIVVADSTVSDELLEQDIEYVLSQDYEFETVTGRAAELGDTVNIDYEGTENGEAFAGGTAQGTDLELGSGRFVANFETELVGLNVGDTKTFDLTFPDDYGATNLAGHTVQFKVTINEIKIKHEAELTDEWVKKHTDGEQSTVEEYKKAVREELEQTLESNSYQQGQFDALGVVISNSEIEVNPDAEKYEYQAQVESIEQQLTAYGMTMDDFAQYYGMTKDEYLANMKSQAGDVVRQKLIVDAVYDAEKMSIDESDYEYVASLYDTTHEDMKGIYSEDVLEQAAKTYKVTRFLYDNAKKTTKAN